MDKHRVRILSEAPAGTGPVDWDAAIRSLRVAAVSPVTWIKPGSKGGLEALHLFVQNKLASYGLGRNDPTKDAVSLLSPYLHFGQVSAQRVALEVSKAHASAACKDAFLEQLIVRRELADNFCYYNPDYDRTAGFPRWAQKTYRSTSRTTGSTFTRWRNLNMHRPMMICGTLPSRG